MVVASVVTNLILILRINYNSYDYCGRNIYGDGDGYGNGYGNGKGNGNGYAYGNGYECGYGYNNGDGCGNGDWICSLI